MGEIPDISLLLPENSRKYLVFVVQATVMTTSISSGNIVTSENGVLLPGVVEEPQMIYIFDEVVKVLSLKI